jgi:hypothetical protein
MTASCNGRGTSACGDASPLRVDPHLAAVTPGRRAADVLCMMLQSAVHVPALSRASGAATPLWHAVELHRPVAELDGACELTVCGALARVAPESSWPRTGTDVCPVCVAHTG